ncbi:MAG: acetyl-CoA carboxylase biotin carboxyl carrier protein subunit, partial [Planctomycetes bacterium]|nr:acetyl-CoA carboxylase biotin carboxyl carrier protein subunit [Planctomycetota bacterium]
VAAGDPLLTLEAMKMETVIRAPSDGSIAEVAVGMKGAVQAGDLLAVMS